MQDTKDMQDMRSIKEKICSPAKVNLLLKVLSRRPDGYHNLVSLVDLISLADTLFIEELDDNSILVEDDKGVLPKGSANTIYKAAMLLKETYAVKEGVRIFVEKKIPIGAGLGGPSSNAATVLKTLVRLWGLPVGPRELMDIGVKVGADVPLFLHGKSCIMRGIGEQIEPIQLPELWYVIVYPGIVLHTRDVYEGLKIPLTLAQNDIKFSAQLSTAFDIARNMENDLEAVAFSLCPQIHTVKERLREAGAIGSLMSGSGSSVFGVFQNEAAAELASGKVRDLGNVFTAHSV
jgi:4-diphosphocytidyl-2-C-methyl-D-erythritol kinase